MEPAGSPETEEREIQLCHARRVLPGLLGYQPLLYNFAVALLLASAALDPEASKAIIAVTIGLFAVHGATHLLRCRGVFFGGEARVPSRPPEMELRDGMPLIAAGTGLLLFFP